ncbi:UDP-glucose 4-epimerase GalE [Idiomarina loihiensis]|uniref:UDP-glucose 4-epimerase GalE n=1 Tax=Idiomarina loihiensis TaxID=135577 RepID=UPI00384D5B65
MKQALVTGGAGYIGSHAVLKLLDVGWKVIVIDDLSNASLESLQRVEKLTGKSCTVIKGSINDSTLLTKVFAQYKVDVVYHFAGWKAVGESTEKPISYYYNNVAGTLTLLSAMEQAGVHKLVFSSSATVYGAPHSVPITESFPTKTTNPYGESKLIVENILRDIATRSKFWSIAILRYFNPIGAHESGEIGEDPTGIPNNLLPFVSQVAIGKLEKLRIFGNDYPTIDGTGVRDYIHVLDLIEGHIKAFQLINENTGVYTINLGTGRGYSVLEIIKTFEQVTNKKIPYEIVARRPGDIASCYTDPSYAYKIIGWSAKHRLEKMLEDTWRWQRKNPNGFE